jgi:hypothetical protein
VVEYFRSGRGDDISRGTSQFMTNLGRSIRDNPIPVALIGTGLCWLMLSSGRRRKDAWEGRYRYDEPEDVDHDELQSYRYTDESPDLKAAAGGGRAHVYGVGGSATAAGSPKSSSSTTGKAGDAQGPGERAADRGPAARERTAGADQAPRERIPHPQQAGHSSQLAKDAPADAVRSAGARGAEAQKAAEAKAREAERRAREIGEAAKEAAKGEVDRQNRGGGGSATP